MYFVNILIFHSSINVVLFDRSIALNIIIRQSLGVGEDAYLLISSCTTQPKYHMQGKLSDLHAFAMNLLKVLRVDAIGTPCKASLAIFVMGMHSSWQREGSGIVEALFC